jgi:transcriptional regulator with XRE-family HTH domain
MTPKEAKQLASRLRAERERLGLSASEVARRAHVNVATVTRIELGQIANPRAENLLAIAAVLGVPAADIFTLTNWLGEDYLPSFSPYMRAKYGDLPESAFAEMQRVFDRMTLRFGTRGPAPGEDE